MYPTVYERRRGTYKGLLFNQELFLCSSVVKDRRAGVFGRSDVRHLRVRHESTGRGERGDKGKLGRAYYRSKLRSVGGAILY